jgi:dCTP deaminase
VRTYYLWLKKLSSHFYLQDFERMIDSRGIIVANAESKLNGSVPLADRDSRRVFMPALPDYWIREMAKTRKMIIPYADLRRRSGRISYGASSYGYDFRLSNEYKVPDLKGIKHLDPKKMEKIQFKDHKGSSCLIPPNSFILGRSLEYFRIPRDVIAVCQGKSTYARCGVIVNVTPLEPEWEGFITLSIVNGAPVPAKIYSGEGIGQILFIRAESECRISYADRKGKYQAQKKIHLSKV